MATTHQVYSMPFAGVYPAYLRKAERKGRTKAELDAVICWLTGYKMTGLTKKFVLKLLLALNVSVVSAASPPTEGTINVSSAPWDGAAYALIIPLGQQSSVLRLDLWGRPHSDGPLTVKFTGQEDPGGGPGRGEGRVSFQQILDKSLAVPLSGRVVFDRLEEGKPVTGHYELATLDQARGFKGFFRLKWGSGGRSGQRVAVP